MHKVLTNRDSCKTVLLLISKGGFAFQRATFNASTIQSAAGQRFFISGDLKTRQQSSREKFIANILYKCTVALGLLGFWHLHLWRHELRCLRSRPSSVSAHQMFSVWHAANQPFTFQPSTKVSGEPGQTEKNQRKKMCSQMDGLIFYGCRTFLILFCGFHSHNSNGHKIRAPVGRKFQTATAAAKARSKWPQVKTLASVSG